MTVPESENSSYVTVGLKPNRGRPGILDSWPRTLSAKDKARVIKLMTACHEVGNGYTLRAKNFVAFKLLNVFYSGVECKVVDRNLSCRVSPRL